MFISSDGGQDGGVSTRLPKSNIVGGVGEGGVRGNTMPWASTSGLIGISIGAERGTMSVLEGLVKIIVGCAYRTVCCWSS
jgi:hypothetical protein